MMVVLLYPDIFLINFLNELGNLKKTNFYTSKCKIFLHFKATDPISIFDNFIENILLIIGLGICYLDSIFVFL